MANLIKERKRIKRGRTQQTSNQPSRPRYANLSESCWKSSTRNDENIYCARAAHEKSFTYLPSDVRSEDLVGPGLPPQLSATCGALHPAYLPGGQNYPPPTNQTKLTKWYNQSWKVSCFPKPRGSAIASVQVYGREDIKYDSRFAIG
ncbi:hypothetical protein C8F04DRAFT_1181564 [Mycena alexandri]|uniref:Uncharacterized protein n=1 Tax=Mycena alexandri TaxID=1745969 RepID=A0AAD6SYA6_9AGAR|nr:hypothetical protein C8F04DRAFT_1181564 [Mycena alexandri]